MALDSVKNSKFGHFCSKQRVARLEKRNFTLLRGNDCSSCGFGAPHAGGFPGRLFLHVIYFRISKKKYLWFWKMFKKMKVFWVSVSNSSVNCYRNSSNKDSLRCFRWLLALQYFDSKMCGSFLLIFRVLLFSYECRKIAKRRKKCEMKR